MLSAAALPLISSALERRAVLPATGQKVPAEGFRIKFVELKSQTHLPFLKAPSKMQLPSPREKGTSCSEKPWRGIVDSLPLSSSVRTYDSSLNF